MEKTDLMVSKTSNGFSLSRFFTFFSKSKKRDFFTFFSLLHTFSRTMKGQEGEEK